MDIIDDPDVSAFWDTIEPVLNYQPARETAAKAGIDTASVLRMKRKEGWPRRTAVVKIATEVAPLLSGQHLIQLYDLADRGRAVREYQNRIMRENGSGGIAIGSLNMGSNAVIHQGAPGMKIEGDLNISGATSESLRAFAGTEVLGTLNVSMNDGDGEPVQMLGAVAPPLGSTLDGHTNVMPDPFNAHDPDTFMAAVRDLWRFTGRTASRKLAERSTDPVTRKPAFSHATAHGLVSEDPEKWPKIKLSHIQGFVRAVGGDKALIGRWTVAWQHVFEGFPLPAPTATTTAEDGRAEAGVIPINRKPAI